MDVKIIELDSQGEQYGEPVLATFPVFPMAGDLLGWRGLVWRIQHTILVATPTMEADPEHPPTLLVTPESGGTATIFPSSAPMASNPSRETLVYSDGPLGSYYLARTPVPGDGVDIRMLLENRDGKFWAWVGYEILGQSRAGHVVRRAQIESGYTAGGRRWYALAS